MNPEDLSDEELHTAIARCQLEMMRMGGNGGPRMDAIQARQDVLQAEDRRRHSIFVNRGFRGGV